MSSMNNMNNMNNMSGFGSQMFESSNGGGRNANGNKQDSNKRGGITKIFIKNVRDFKLRRVKISLEIQFDFILASILMGRTSPKREVQSSGPHRIR